MSKGRKILGSALTLGAVLWIVYYILKIKGYVSINAAALSDEQITAIKKSIQTSVVVSGFLIGGLLGAVVQRSKFCIAAACHNVVTTRDLTQTRAYAMALFVAIPATQLLYRAGIVDISRSIYISSPFTWVSYILGGFIFGVGIVYAGGCASRILVRAGEGNLGGLVSVLAFIVSSGATLWGISAKVRVDYLDKLTLNLKSQYLPNIFSQVPGWAIILLIEAALLIFMLMAPKDSEWRKLKWPLAGAAIGVLVAAAWWVNGLAFTALPHVDTFSFSGPDDPTLLQAWGPKSLTFALADAQAFRYIILWTGETINFAVATVFGVIAGALISSLISGTFNWVAPPLQQFKYNLIGGLLMGFGAVLAMGCNIGQGLSGISTLSAGSFLTMSFIFAGAIAGAKFMTWRIMREA